MADRFGACESRRPAARPGGLIPRSRRALGDDPAPGAERGHLLGAGKAWDAWTAGDVLEGAVAWPTWIAAALVPLGVGLLLARLLLSAVAHALSALTGRRWIDLPPLSGSDEAI